MSSQQYPSSEYELLAGLEHPYLQKAFGPYSIATGDDAAVRDCATGERLIYTTDISIEHVHFSLEYMSFEEIGYRVMVRNLSDCAAMAAKPDGALVQLVFPRSDTIRTEIHSIYKGFFEACERWSFPIVGGDLSSGPCWMIGITLIGSVNRGERILTRKGAQSGDSVWISGPAGKSRAGLAVLQKYGPDFPQKYQSLVASHINPSPRIEMARSLASCDSVHAMMDMSDGISKDSATLCYENNLHLQLDIRSLPPDEAMVELSEELGIPWAQWVLHGGEEYELLFAASADFETHCNNRKGFLRLGSLSDGDSGVSIIDESGMEHSLENYSWDHLGGEWNDRSVE